MSYCRFGNDSDVYVFESGMGIRVLHASLNEEHDELTPEIHDDMVFESKTSTLEHLLLIKSRGGLVPQYAIDRLMEELELCPE